MEFKSLLISAAMTVVVLAASAAARPHTPRSVDLGDAVNRTVCPITVSVDEDRERIPRRIKLVRCAADPQAVCRAQQIPAHECCAHTHNRRVMECVELHDRVLVRYPRAADGVTSKALTVPVGCSCMVSASIEGSTIPPPT